MTEETPTGHMQDSYYMGVAIRKAKEAAERGEVPVGAILVRDGEIYSSGGNERENVGDPTAHAEVVALRHAASVGGGWRLEGATLYVTVEPCLLCTGAVYLSRLSRVVFGCPNPKGGALRFVAEHGKDLKLNHAVEIVGGVREMECAQLMRSFFAERRSG